MKNKVFVNSGAKNFCQVFFLMGLFFVSCPIAGMGIGGAFRRALFTQYKRGYHLRSVCLAGLSSAAFWSNYSRAVGDDIAGEDAEEKERAAQGEERSEKSEEQLRAMLPGRGRGKVDKARKVAVEVPGSFHAHTAEIDVWYGAFSPDFVGPTKNTGIIDFLKQ